MVGKLTGKQLEMLKLRYAGFRNKEIALKMNVSESDVSQTLFRAAENMASICRNLELMKEIGFIKYDLQIELTKKGSDSFNKWKDEWIRDFKSSSACKVQTQKINSNILSIEASESLTSNDNSTDIKVIKKQIYDLRQGVADQRQLLLSLMSRLETKKEDRTIMVGQKALPQVQYQDEGLLSIDLDIILLEKMPSGSCVIAKSKEGIHAITICKEGKKIKIFPIEAN